MGITGKGSRSRTHLIKNLGSGTRPVPVNLRTGHPMRVQLGFFPCHCTRP